MHVVRPLFEIALPDDVVELEFENNYFHFKTRIDIGKKGY